MKVQFCVKIQYGLWLLVCVGLGFQMDKNVQLLIFDGFYKVAHGFQRFFFLTRNRLVWNQDIWIETSAFSMCDSHRSTEIVTVLSTNIAFDKFSFFCPTVVVACFFMIFLLLSPSPILFWKSRLLVLIRGSLCQVEVHIPMAVEWKPMSCC